jgi:hypothetical protein
VKVNLRPYRISPGGRFRRRFVGREYVGAPFSNSARLSWCHRSPHRRQSLGASFDLYQLPVRYDGSVFAYSRRTDQLRFGLILILAAQHLGDHAVDEPHAVQWARACSFLNSLNTSATGGRS